MGEVQKMNETKFVKQLKDTFLAKASDENRELPVTWKLRGSASTAGRPDLLVVDAGKTFFIEAKYVKVKDKIDLLEPVTDLQRANLESIIAAGGNTFLATGFEKKNGKVNKYGIILSLHKMVNCEMKLPKKITIPTRVNGQEEITFALPRHSFLIMNRKSKWFNTEYFRDNCND